MPVVNGRFYSDEDLNKYVEILETLCTRQAIEAHRRYRNTCICAAIATIAALANIFLWYLANY